MLLFWHCSIAWLPVCCPLIYGCQFLLSTNANAYLML